jgi:hypothetical protein
LARCAVPEAFGWLTVRAEADSAAGLIVVGALEMCMMNKAMTASTAVVAPVSTQSIRRWRRRRLRRLAATLAWRTSESQPGEGVPIPSG